jgi:hypothetical protein
MSLSTHDRHILDHRVRGLVTEELLAEARAHPFGPHSPELVEVLDFLRRSPDPELPRYVVIDTGAGFAVGARAVIGGHPPRRFDDKLWPTRAAAEHAIFLRRLNDYGIDA